MPVSWYERVTFSELLDLCEGNPPTTGCSDAKFVVYIVFSEGPFYQHGLTEITAWISDPTQVVKREVVTHPCCNFNDELTHWDRATHICVSKLTIIASDNGLSPGRRQAIIRNNAGILSIRPLGTYFNEILIEILTFSFKKVSSAKWRPFCPGLNVLT